MDFLRVASEIFSPVNLIFMNIGVACGIIIGALPGLTVVLAITVLLPFTFGLDSLSGMFLLLGAYCGGAYGGSIAAILINAPGTPNSAATVLDGYPLAQNGRAGDALKAALVASTIGGMISCFALMFLAPPIASVALEFGPAEYFSLCLFGLCVVVSVSGGSVTKGLAMAGLGVLLSTVGMDAISGTVRFSFNRPELMGGITPIAVMLGVFAVSEVLIKSHKMDQSVSVEMKFDHATMKIGDMLRHWKTIVRSSLLGVFIGAVPGTGGAIAAFMSYNIAMNSSKEPEKFGKGNIEGVLAPEAANNGVTGATLIPLLTLGVPGDTAMAVLLGALTMQGITPGPTLFTGDRFWVWSIMGGLILINLFMLIQGNLFIRAFINITKLPPTILVPSILLFSVLGSYAIRNYTFDVMLMLAFGFVGYLCKRLDYPIPPLVIGLMLGQLVETNLRRAMVLSRGSLSIFFTHPISLAFLIICVFSLIFPSLRSAHLKKRKVKG